MHQMEFYKPIIFNISKCLKGKIYYYFRRCLIFFSVEASTTPEVCKNEVFYIQTITDSDDTKRPPLF